MLATGACTTAGFIKHFGAGWQYSWCAVFFTGSLDGYADLMHASARTMVQRLAGPAQSGESVEIWRLLVRLCSCKLALCLEET